MRPPDRFADARFENYEIHEDSQAKAHFEAIRFVEAIRRERRLGHRLRRFLGIKRTALPRGLYFVGPVGTGKTHLLAAMYHALHPEVPCIFLHSSRLYRLSEPPEILGNRLADQYEVVCLDEVEADDPANEARLIALLDVLGTRGVTILATSNVEPERFMSIAYGNDRFRRFLIEQFHDEYAVLFVGGKDYRRRQQRTGHAWIGERAATRSCMYQVFESEVCRKRWFQFDEFQRLTIEVEHTKVVSLLQGHDALFIEDIVIESSDDALRLLRVIDDLYILPEPPKIYFTSRHVPEEWFEATVVQGGLDKAVADKFERTTSRLHAMCHVEIVGDFSSDVLKKSA